MDVKHCSYCGGFGWVESRVFCDSLLYHVECAECNASGPESEECQEVVMAWNHTMGLIQDNPWGNKKTGLADWGNAPDWAQEYEEVDNG